MGSMINAICDCGFQSGTIMVGGGMLNFDTVCYAPAICLRFNIFLVKNYLKKYSKCPKCRKKVVFYNNPIVQEKLKRNENRYNDIFSWRLEKSEFQLLDLNYLCPECGKMSLRFVREGHWD